jgi:hypothetical protein
MTQLTKQGPAQAGEVSPFLAPIPRAPLERGSARGHQTYSVEAYLMTLQHRLRS